VSRAVRRAVAAADAGSERPGPGPVFDGVLDAVWRLALAFQARARPRRLKRLLAGTPSFGDTTIRCRVGSVEVLAGPGVFVPSPDADLFVDLASTGLQSLDAPTIVEVGTGCGAIALALARARIDANVHATELSSSAVRWAGRNARRLGLGRVRFHRGSLLGPLPADLRGRVDLIIANLPYFPARDYASIGSIPRGTIQGGGDDGLDLIRRLARDAIPFLRPGGGLLLQMFAWQWEAFAAELVALGYRPRTPRVSGAFVIGPADLVAGAVPVA
jgi:methylase of polypeptide subunit release factors